MLHTVLLSLILFVSLSSSISRRQIDPQYCQAIEGFECKCSYYLVTCTNDRDLPSTINILENEKYQYQSVELVIRAPRDIVVNDQTFAPVKQLYKPDADNLEFRIQIERFTSLNLASPGLFNQVFPDNLPANTQKNLALDIYDPDVPPSENTGLFKNFNADSLELYALYPFNGSFQQLFDGANIKFLRLAGGGDIRSDVSQPFTGIVGRLELARQASALSVQNFPVYPAHELIINAFYISDFNNEYPPNYNNLDELRVHTQERIPANAFRNFPNLRSLSISTEQDIDSQALNGLNKLEKLTIKDGKATLELLNSVPSVKEFEVNIEKLDKNTQCQLIEKLANGQVAVLAIPEGSECTCVSAYLDTAARRTPCAAQDCEYSSCAVIKNNYDASTRTFKTPVAITRSDGTDALRQREPKVYTSPYQISNEDQEKLQQGIPQQVQEKDDDKEGQRETNESYNPLQPQEQDQNDYTDEIDSIIVNNEEEKANEQQADVICFNLSGRNYLCMLVFDINEEKDSILYKNDSTGYFYEYYETGAGVKQTEVKDFFEKRIGKKSDLSYNEAIQFAISKLSKILSIDLKLSDIEIGVITKDNIEFRMLTENEIEHLTQIVKK